MGNATGIPQADTRTAEDAIPAGTPRPAGIAPPWGTWTVPAPPDRRGRIGSRRLTVYPPSPVFPAAPLTAATVPVPSGDDSGLLPEDADVPSGVRSNRKREIAEHVIVLLVGLAFALFVHTHVLQMFLIPTDSMSPTLLVDDRMAVWQPAGLDSFDRGDIIVFYHPVGTPCTVDPDAPDVFVKRVIGLPEETVTAPDGKVQVDGKPINEPYVPDGVTTTILEPMKVPDGQLLVLGDNREVSLDGRCFGTIGDDAIVGRAVAKVWPLDRIGTL